MRLTGAIHPVASLTSAIQARMFALMAAHYDNLDQDKFLHDLSEKEAVLLLSDAAGQLQGFTTFVIIETQFHGQTIFVLYSGDTIVAREWWGQLELFRVFGGLFATLLREQREPLYWLLLTKGIRTYGLLPLLFTTFYPNYAGPTPMYEQELLDTLATQKFGACYHKEHGIVRFTPKADYLSRELAEVPAHKRQNPHIRFFLDHNPGYIEGDELVCLTRIAWRNFSRAARRFLKTRDKISHNSGICLVSTNF